MAQTIRVLGIEIATLVCHVVGMDDAGHVVLRTRLARRAWPRFLATWPPLRSGMDACGRAHDWARRVLEPGHDVRLIAPSCITASGKSPTREARDAEALCEAVSRPTRRVVPITRVEPQDLQALHRVRERRIQARTALVQESRGLLRADGMMLPQGLTTCRRRIVQTLGAGQAQLTPCRRARFRHLDEAFLALDPRLAADDEPLPAIGPAPPACPRLQTIPGSGPVRATARIAASGEATPFKHGRQLAAWLGLVPRAHSTGGQPRLLGINKRGDVSRRTVLVHGARATRRWVDTKSDDRRRSVRALSARRGKSRAAVA